MPRGRVRDIRTDRRLSAKHIHIGAVTLYRRGSAWYVYYREDGRTRRLRASRKRREAERIAAEINAQVSAGLRSTFGYDKISAEAVVRHLRTVKISPNGSSKAKKRLMKDKGVLHVLRTCRTLVNYAARHRHMPPYATNPFTDLRIERMKIENKKRIVLFTQAEEAAFLEACPPWEFRVFFTLEMTGHYTHTASVTLARGMKQAAELRQEALKVARHRMADGALARAAGA